MKMPLVSIVMPTFNSGQFIRETIHSLIEQTYPRFELIVVDGGSTDDTLAIVKSYMGDDDVELIELAPGLGIPRALNEGLAAAKGEFIARMDADDIAYPNRLTEQVRFLASIPDVGFVGSGVDQFWASSGSARSPQWHDHIVDSYLTNNPFYHPTIMFRRSLYEDGLYRYDENQVCDEDYELWGRLLTQTKAANIDASLLKYRIHAQNAQGP
jgi:glycosyltransferase involved in cell wall biosynthesis